VRAVAFVLAVLVSSVSGAGAQSLGPKVAFLHGSTLVVADATNGAQEISATHVSGQPAWSGDGQLLSVGGRIVNGPILGREPIAWAPTGETAAFQTPDGAVYTWSTGAGKRLVVPASWGAVSFAWGPHGVLALSRSICHVPCGVPKHQEVWTWRAGKLRRVVGPLPGVQTPLIAAVTGTGVPLWWSDPQGSASIAADGLSLFRGGSGRLGIMLVYSDYVTVCGPHVALAVGTDRYAMHGKRIVFDGRDAPRDSSRSWVSPSCSADGKTLVAAASENAVPPRIGREHRAIWELIPERKQLTNPPAGLTDEYPRVLGDGSVMFIRARSVSKPLRLYGVGTVEVLRHGKLLKLGTASKADNFYGHYAWPDLVAVVP
jgi:hypothetical protein